MATKATSIQAADLAKFTQAAVKAVAQTTRITKGPIWGYVLPEGMRAAQQLELATKIAAEVTANAKAGGVAGLKVGPAVILKPGKILAGFIERELNIEIR